MAQVRTQRIYKKSDLLENSHKKQTEALSENITVAVARNTVSNNVKKSRGEKIVTKSVPAKNKTFPAVLVIFSLICTSMIILMVFNYARQYEASVNLSRQKKELERINSELALVENQINTAVSSLELEAYSTDELGYVSAEQLPYRVVSANREDKIVSTESNKEIGGFEMLLSTIKGLFE